VRFKLSSLPGLNVPLGTPSAGSAGSGSASANLGFIFDLSNYDQGVTISPPPADQVQS
jgi:hypothetical protein